MGVLSFLFGGGKRKRSRGRTPLSESYWKRKIPPNQRFSNLGAALATPPNKKSQRASKVNRHNKNVINNHKRDKEQAENDRQRAEQEAERLRGKLHEASVLFEQIQSLATSYPSHWVSRVRANAGKGVGVCHG